MGNISVGFFFPDLGIDHTPVRNQSDVRVAHTNDHSLQGLRQKDHKFKASLGNKVRPCKKKKKKPEQSLGVVPYCHCSWVGKPLLLKTQHILGTEHGKIKLILAWKYAS